jgi:PleD family two-component response regulator
MPEPSPEDRRVLIFENQPKQAEAYRELFTARGFSADTALPSQDVKAICQSLRPQVVIFDMGFWEGDTAYVFGVLNEAEGFERPVIIGLSTLPHQTRRAKRFGADGIWIRGVDDAVGLVQVAGDLLERRRAGALKPRIPTTPL